VRAGARRARRCKAWRCTARAGAFGRRHAMLPSRAPLMRAGKGGDGWAKWDRQPAAVCGRIPSQAGPRAAGAAGGLGSWRLCPPVPARPRLPALLVGHPAPFGGQHVAFLSPTPFHVECTQFLTPLRRRAVPAPAGKYKAGTSKPSGPRQLVFSDQRLREIEPLLATLKAVADTRGKSMAQVGPASPPEPAAARRRRWGSGCGGRVTDSLLPGRCPK
jgi:hypothetical protein